ncbi:hypothetical protein [Nannocystis pusilla]|uniref:Cytochrome P460 domain-containing protein n=1 Tax=Nannocystis pusilla TaxID=889268 RepID=A0ABS7TI30_9BACT|nr:hypothetical protein [Nannocystis pusilla]MBZ5707846.1 hypothetical protein [Nannocystis pusilla]
MKIWTCLVALTLVAACGDDGGGGTDTAGDDARQVPPTSGKVAMRAWLAEGHYKQWACESGAHDATITVSPHGKQRICSNDVLATHGDGEYPVDAAAVKELYDAAGAELIGYAVYRRVKPGSEGGSWYWYEEVPDDHPAPHDDDGIVADGLGDSGPAKNICVTCHALAGTDADHPGQDFVYVQVQ